jgi:type IV pilus assembly protein PilC
MNYDEFAFFNQQLAAMLRDGIPLEGALKQLCEGMQTGALREEIRDLQADLGRGTPLKESLARRKLPSFYVHLLELGSRTNDLPGVLTLVADHYHRANALWTRLKGLMVYPLLVILVALGLTTLLTVVFRHFMLHFFDDMIRAPGILVNAVWVPPVILVLAGALGVGAVTIPSWRNWLRWRLPAFREASLAQLASAIALMLRKGTPLPEALALAEGLESRTPAGNALRQWRGLIESGQGKPAQWALEKSVFPPLFLWLVKTGGEDVASGFEKAASIYQARAAYRTEMALYGALPVSILLLGQMALWQIWPLFQAMISLMNTLGDMGGGDKN